MNAIAIKEQEAKCKFKNPDGFMKNWFLTKIIYLNMVKIIKFLES